MLACAARARLAPAAHSGRRQCSRPPQPVQRAPALRFILNPTSGSPALPSAAPSRARPPPGAPVHRMHPARLPRRLLVCLCLAAAAAAAGRAPSPNIIM